MRLIREPVRLRCHHGVCDDRPMISMNHEDGFLDLNPSDFIREDWERIEAKALQVDSP
jgi:hypothetical protein